MTTEATILIKIKKLMEMAKSAQEIGNTHEAAAFGARVQQLLRSYKLEMAEVQDIDLNADDKIEVDSEYFAWDEAGIARSKHRSHWLLALTYYVCEYNNCKCHGAINSNMVAIIGTESSRAVVTWLLVTLSRYGREAMEASYRKEYYKAKKLDSEQGTNINVYEMKGYRRSFVSTYVSTVGMRLKAQYDSDNAEVVSSRGLMVLNKEKDAVDAFLSDLELTKGNKFRGHHNRAGMDNGTAAGNSATVKCNGVQGTEKKKIGA